MRRLLIVVCISLMIWGGDVGLWPMGAMAQTPPSDLSVEVNVGYEAGWSLLTLPVDPGEALSMSEAFPGAEEVLVYQSESFVPASTVEVGAVYWVRYQEAGSLTFEGNQITRREIELSPGWTPVAALTQSVRTQEIETAPGDVSIEWYSIRGGKSDTVDVLQPGSGYWVYTDQQTNITVQSSPLQRSSSLIEISDAATLLSDSTEYADGILILGFPDQPPSITEGTVVQGSHRSGYLREVTRVQRDENILTLYTEQASLADAITNGVLSTSIGFNIGSAEPDGIDQSIAQGNTAVGKQQIRLSHPGVSATRTEFSISNLSLTASRDYDVQIASGIIRGNLYADLEFVTSEGEMEKVKAILHGNLWTSVSIELLFSVAASGSASVTLGTISRDVVIHGIPSEIVLELSASTEYSCDAALSSYAYDYQHESSLSIGFDGTDGIFERAASFSSSTNSPLLSANCTNKISIEPELSVEMFGIAGPAVSVDNYITLESQQFDQNWDHHLYAGLDGSAGIKTSISSNALFGGVNMGPRFRFFRSRKTLWRSPTEIRLLTEPLRNGSNYVFNLGVFGSLDRPQENVSIHYFSTQDTDDEPQQVRTDGLGTAEIEWVPSSNDDIFFAVIKNAHGELIDAFSQRADRTPTLHIKSPMSVHVKANDYFLPPIKVNINGVIEGSAVIDVKDSSNNVLHSEEVTSDTLITFSRIRNNLTSSTSSQTLTFALVYEGYTVDADMISTYVTSSNRIHVQVGYMAPTGCAFYSESIPITHLFGNTYSLYYLNDTKADNYRLTHIISGLAVIDNNRITVKISDTRERNRRVGSYYLRDWNVSASGLFRSGTSSPNNLSSFSRVHTTLCASGDCESYNFDSDQDECASVWYFR